MWNLMVICLLRKNVDSRSWRCQKYKLNILASLISSRLLVQPNADVSHLDLTTLWIWLKDVVSTSAISSDNDDFHNRGNLISNPIRCSRLDLEKLNNHNMNFTCSLQLKGLAPLLCSPIVGCANFSSRSHSNDVCMPMSIHNPARLFN